MEGKSLSVVVNYDIPQILGEDTLSVNEIASRCEPNLHPPRLLAVLRCLSSLGIFREEGDLTGRFVNTPLSLRLRRDDPKHLNAYVRYTNGEIFKAGSHFEEVCQIRHAKSSGYELALGMPYFDFLKRNATIAANFNKVMIAVGNRTLEGLVNGKPRASRKREPSAHTLNFSQRLSMAGASKQCFRRCCRRAGLGFGCDLEKPHKPSCGCKYQQFMFQVSGRS